MFYTLGEHRERRRQNRNRFVLFVLCCTVIAGCTGYLFSLDSENGTNPTDIVQGTGDNMGEFEVAYSGPSELKVKWDEVIGQAWSIAYVTGWAQNASTKDIRFKNIIYRVKDENGNIIWEDTDDRFAGGFTLEPMEYFDFGVMPICQRPAKIFEMAVEDADLINR